MPRTRRSYVCASCGHRSPSYTGRCPACSAWNTLEQVDEARPSAIRSPAATTALALAQPFGSQAPEPDVRLCSRLDEFDRVLGGGLVPGSVVLLGGEPGIGKSTLMLQVAGLIAAPSSPVAYICGEESARQVRARGARLGVGGDGLALIAETDIEAALAAATALEPALTIVDSIQSANVAGLDSRVGGPAQLAEAGARIVAWAKQNEIATIVTGHVTKAGEIAGPKLLEHAVDAVLYFEDASSASLRVLRAVKNRFGATDEVGVFEMTGAGLTSVENPSAAFVDAESLASSGCAATAVIEGSRPIAAEVQALAVRSYTASPRRIASGIEVARLHLLLAVLARRGGIDSADRDVVATVTGGLRLRDPGADLAILAALASAIRDEPLRAGCAFLGEVALSGRIRTVPQASRRLAELARIGIATCAVPVGTEAIEGLRVVPIANVAEALEFALEE